MGFSLLPLFYYQNRMDGKHYLPTAFDDSLTTVEKYNHMLEIMQVIIDKHNELVTEWNKGVILASYETENRPTEDLEVGLTIIDTTLNQMIWYDGSNWRSQDGNVV